MKLAPSDLRQLAELAIVAATEAAQMIGQSQPTEVRHKAGGASLASQVVTEIDRRSEDIVVGALTPSLDRYELGLLTEEQDDNGSRLATDYFWSIDPLDGTLPFVEGTSGYAVSIGLVGSDGVPWIGVVCDPVEATVRHAIRGGGAFVDGRPWSAGPTSNADVLTVFADRSFRQWDSLDDVVYGLERIARDRGLAGVEIETTGGAVMNATRVLDQRTACYFKFPKPDGGGSLWDFAATACLCLERGAVVTDMYGGQLDLNRAESTLMNHRGVLFATDDDLARHVRALLPARA